MDPHRRSAPAAPSACVRAAWLALALVALSGVLSLWLAGVISTDPTRHEPAPEPSPAFRPTTDDEVPSTKLLPAVLPSEPPLPIEAATDAPDVDGTQVADAEEALRPETRPLLVRYRAAEDEDERNDALLELALSDDPAVLPLLLEELRTVEPERREALLEAVIQYGSRDAVPELRELARRAATPAERELLNEAADYLTLPSLREIESGAVPIASNAQRVERE